MKLTPLKLALALLTALPVAKYLKETDYNETKRTAAIDYYGFVGLLLGITLFLVSQLLRPILPGYLASVILLISWVAITGALHLDGLADCSDAAAAGHRDSSNYLTIMKSSEVGAMALVAVCLQLLFKAALITALLQSSASNLDLFLALATATTLSRILAGFYQQTTPYARDIGLGLAVTQAVFINNGLIAAALCMALAIAISLASTMSVVAGSVLLLLCWRHFWLKRIAGYTGDCVGAFIELNESLVLILFIVTAGISQ